jgi:nucleotide-binding universal stress UspA family protein
MSVDQAGVAQLSHYAQTRADGIEATVLVGYDDSPAHGILQIAASHEVDAIVIASHGRTGMTRWLLGSIAEKIARTAEVPVIIVPARTTEPTP